MPNIVHNQLSINFHNEKEFEDFTNRITKEKQASSEAFYSLAYSLFPPPKDENEYDWTIENYGGKWGDWYTSTRHKYRENIALYEFDSAWAPLITLAEKIADLTERQVTLSFWSMDNMYEGKVTIDENGTLIEDEYRELDYEDFQMVPVEEE